MKTAQSTRYSLRLFNAQVTLALASAICCLVLWHLVAVAVHSVLFPGPPRVFAALSEILRNGDLVEALSLTLRRTLVGYIMAAVFGIPFGILIGSHRFAYRLTWPGIDFVRVLPIPALLPVLILLLGVGELMYSILIVIGAIFPILIHTAEGVRATNQTLSDVSRILHVDRVRLWVSVLLPNALPEVFSGLKISLPISMLIALLAEMLAGSDGLGHLIIIYQRSFEIPQMYAAAFIIALCGLTINLAFDGAENRLLGWHYR